MRKHVIVFSIFMLTGNLIVNSQVYAGKKFGRLEFLNDSICTFQFFQDHFDTLTYRKDGGYVYLNSLENKTRFEVKELSEGPSILVGRPVFMKIFRKNKYGRYDFHSEFLGLIDTLNSNIREFDYWNVKKNDIVVIKILNGYKRILCLEDQFFKNGVLIYDYIPFFDLKTIFNEFPIKVNDRRVISVCNRKNFEFWVDNGFYFPKMNKSTLKENDGLVYYAVRTRGKQGLPFGRRTVKSWKKSLK